QRELALLSRLLLLYDPTISELYALSLHDALPIFDRADVRWPTQYARDDEHRHPRDVLGQCRRGVVVALRLRASASSARGGPDLRSEEHTSELQSRENLVCRLLLEKKKYTLLTQRT